MIEVHYILMVLKDGSTYIIPSEERHLVPDSVMTMVGIKSMPMIAASAQAKRKALLDVR